MLRKLRITLGLTAFVLITFLFLDFASIIPATKIPIDRIQFIPALLSLSFGIVASLLIITLVFGRIYCSVICPLGIFQDIADRFSRVFKKRKLYRYSREKKLVRYGSLLLIVGSWLSGFTLLLALFDPYSGYGRIVTNIFRPIYLVGNNLLASLLPHLGATSFYKADLFLLSSTALMVSILTFFIVGYLAWKFGRIWCNTFCPVGTILGFISRFSMFKFQFVESKCNQCGACSFKCKSSCIDIKNEKIDSSRCVTCFNCTTTCKQKAMAYTFSWKKSSKPSEIDTKHSESRRRFLGTIGITTVAAGTQLWAQKSPVKLQSTLTRKNPISPPGSESFGHFNAHCTSCHLCVSKCPSNILKPSFMEFGLEGMMQPKVDFTRGFCAYDCTICSEVCPTGAIKPLTIEQKHKVQMGYAVFVKHSCIVHTTETNCGACADNCPTQAILMVPYKDELSIPEVDTKICIGCGGCEYVCPAKPLKAIYVEGIPTQTDVVIPIEKVQAVDSFGF